MSFQVDNCCDCGTTQLHASVFAHFTWPGFANFNTSGPGIDTINERYQTATVTVIDDVGATFTKAITCNKFNGCFNDTVTGTDASAGTWITPGLRLAWPPDTISPDGRTATWTGLGSIVLSDVVDAAWCKTQAQAILDSVDLLTLTLGTDGFYLAYDQNLTDDHAYTAQGIGWLMLGVWDDGITGLKWGWGDVQTGVLYTSDGNNGNAVFTPFTNVTPAITKFGDEFPPTPGSENYYEQEAHWTMRKSVSNMVTGPVCCEDDFALFAIPPSISPPDPVCQMIADDGHGHLILNPPALAFNQPDSSRFVFRTPFFGKALTGGGCPCA
jgi:hypothetical protein